MPCVPDQKTRPDPGKSIGLLHTNLVLVCCLHKCRVKRQERKRETGEQDISKEQATKTWTWEHEPMAKQALMVRRSINVWKKEELLLSLFSSCCRNRVYFLYLQTVDEEEVATQALLQLGKESFFLKIPLLFSCFLENAMLLMRCISTCRLFKSEE
mgnify:CR=1 FL=1